MDTLTKALERNCDQPEIAKSNWLGTRVEDHYEWVTYADAVEIAKNLCKGISALEMVPEIEAEG